MRIAILKNLFPEIANKGGVASSVTSFLNSISHLDKTTYFVNMDIEIINVNNGPLNKHIFNFPSLFFLQIPEENKTSPKPAYN